MHLFGKDEFKEKIDELGFSEDEALEILSTVQRFHLSIDELNRALFLYGNIMEKDRIALTHKDIVPTIHSIYSNDSKKTMNELIDLYHNIVPIDMGEGLAPLNRLMNTIKFGKFFTYYTAMDFLQTIIDAIELYPYSITISPRSGWIYLNLPIVKSSDGGSIDLAPAKLDIAESKEIVSPNGTKLSRIVAIKMPAPFTPQDKPFKRSKNKKQKDSKN